MVLTIADVRNPGLAELLHASILGAARSYDEVGPLLAAMPAGEVRQRLLARLVDQLPSDQQLVIEALAAFGIPIPATAVAVVLDPEVDGDRCTRAIDALLAARVVHRRRDGRLQIPPADIDTILDRIDRGDRYADPGERPTSRDLLHRAANELYHLQKSDEDVHQVGDLDLHFAQLDLYLRARMFAEAHELIESMDVMLRAWDSGGLLRRQREAVRDHLGGDDEAAMENLNALGDIYSSIGAIDAADQAFRAALDIATRETDRDAMRAIYLTMGNRYSEHDDIGAARHNYTRALALAQEDYDEQDRVLALEGLADCDQQWGSYASAIAAAQHALTAARDCGSDRVLDLALKLARWQSERGELAAAADALAVADAITDGTERRRRAEFLNTRADLLLHRRRYHDAVTAGELAVAEAEDRRNPVSLLHALTTLALAHLYQDEIGAADRTITRAMRYREGGRQLTTLTLRALVAVRRSHQATAGDFFARLAAEAQQRIDRDARDSWAWDYRGLARCFIGLNGRPKDLEQALADFRRAATSPAEPTPGRDCRLTFLVRQLAVDQTRLPEGLVAVLDDLVLSRPCLPGRAP